MHKNRSLRCKNFYVFFVFLIFFVSRPIIVYGAEKCTCSGSVSLSGLASMFVGEEKVKEFCAKIPGGKYQPPSNCSGNIIVSVASKAECEGYTTDKILNTFGLGGYKNYVIINGSCSPTDTSTRPLGYLTENTYGLPNPLGTTDIDVLIGYFIKAILGIIGSITLFMVIYSGFILIFSNGDSEKIDKGRRSFTWSMLGLILVFFSYLIVRVLFDTLIK